MKRILVLSLCGTLLFTGCNRKNAQKEEGEPRAESANKSNLVEMSVSAQQHIGMQAPGAACTRNAVQYFRRSWFCRIVWNCGLEWNRSADIHPGLEEQRNATRVRN